MPYYLLADIVVTSIVYTNVGNFANTLKIKNFVPNMLLQTASLYR